MTRFLRPAVVALLLATPAAATAQEPAAAKKPAKASIYDAKADAREQVKAATALARRDSRRVLVMFGGDWCGWCHKLHGLFASDKAIHKVLADEYVLVMVDIKAPNAESLLAECAGDLQGVGYPFLAVLDGARKVVARQKTDPLEEGDHHDPAKVKSFLETWAAPRASATGLLDAALARASSEDKLVFLHFGTPTCGWCHKLEAFLAREDMSRVFGLDFVDLKLDLARAGGAEEVLRRYHPGKSGGVPWFVFLDAKGRAIVTSDGPEGNIGYPAEPAEIAHFVAMLKQAGRKIDAAQIGAIEAALKAEGEKLRATPAKPAG